VPCRTAPFASFSGRTEKEGTARPVRIPMVSSLVRVIKKTSVTGNFYEIVMTQRCPFFDRLQGRSAPFLTLQNCSAAVRFSDGSFRSPLLKWNHLKRPCSRCVYRRSFIYGIHFKGGTSRKILREPWKCHQGS
jgi:hypothetical protein